jgi:hypothetical protein
MFTEVQSEVRRRVSTEVQSEVSQKAHEKAKEELEDFGERLKEHKKLLLRSVRAEIPKEWYSYITSSGADIKRRTLQQVDTEMTARCESKLHALARDAALRAGLLAEAERMADEKLAGLHRQVFFNSSALVLLTCTVIVFGSSYLKP